LERHWVKAARRPLAVVVVVALDDDATVEEPPQAPRSRTPQPSAATIRDRELVIIEVK
jgi:hypothetical protein